MVKSLSKHFELEEAIMSAWQTENDLDIIFEYLYEEKPIDNDVFANLLLGLKHLHSARMSKVWLMFEAYLKEVNKAEEERMNIIGQNGNVGYKDLDWYLDEAKQE